MVVLHPISLPKGGQGGQKGDGKEIYEKGKAQWASERETEQEGRRKGEWNHLHPNTEIRLC